MIIKTQTTILCSIHVECELMRIKLKLFKLKAELSISTCLSTTERYKCSNYPVSSLGVTCTCTLRYFYKLNVIDNRSIVFKMQANFGIILRSRLEAK